MRSVLKSIQTAEILMYLDSVENILIQKRVRFILGRGIIRQYQKYVQILVLMRMMIITIGVAWNIWIIVITVMIITNGAQLYYTPATMVPEGSTPNWDFDALEGVTIDGVDPYYEARFYKYK